MAFLDLFRFKKKPFKEPQETKKQAEKAEMESAPVKNEGIALRPSPFSGVLVRPYLSEKSTLLAEQSKFVFEVDPRATEEEVRQAVKAVYGVEPLKVCVLKLRGKSVRYGRTLGKTKMRKKAIITLPAGKKIDIYK
jgi:large subunit ribosomal protein L23